MNELRSKYSEEIQATLAKYPPERKRSAVLPLLNLAQRAGGFVSRQAVNEIAEILDLDPTEVGSVAGFYTLVHPAEDGGGRYRIQVCTDLPCALRGAEDFLNQLCEALGVQPGGTTADGLITVEAVKCLAACHRAPLFQVQGGGEIHYHENQTLQSALTVVESLRQMAGGESK